MNKNRQQIQSEAELAFYNSNWNSILLISQRVGKSKITCNIITKYLYMFPDDIIDIYVPFVNLIEDTWKPELIKWIGSVPKNIVFKTHISINKEKNFNNNFQVIDEVHLLSESQLKNFKKAKYCLGLTGTLSSETKWDLKNKLKLKVSYEYSIFQAVKDGIIANFKVNLVHCQLDNVNKNVLSGTKLKPVYTTELGHYNYLSSQFERFKFLSFGDDKFFALKEIYSGKRMRFIYNSETKINIVNKFIKQRNKDKLLIFTANTEVANRLSIHSYHSKSEGTELEDFKNNKFNHLSCCKMISVGITIPKLNTLIIQQLNSNEETTSQILARALNLDYADKIADIWIFVLDNTVDENWCKKSLNWIPIDKINHINYKEL